MFEQSKATERKLQKDLLSKQSNDTMAIWLSHPTKKRNIYSKNKREFMDASKDNESIKP